MSLPSSGAKNKARNQHESRWQRAGDMFLRNVGLISTGFTALYPRKIEVFITTAARTSDSTSFREKY
jgi:hypothetical protein